MLRILFCYVALFQSYTLQAQETVYSFERISSLKWFDQSGINAIAQDQNGFMWFATNNGLIMFDGYTSHEYLHNPYDNTSLPHNNVNTVYIDKYGVLWVGTWGGLAKFDIKSETFYRYRNDPKNLKSLIGNDVRSICEDLFGNLWVATYGNGISKLTRKTEEFQSFMYSSSYSNSVSSNYVNFIKPSIDGKLWIGTRRGLNKLDPTNTRFTAFLTGDKDDEGINDNNITDLVETKNGDVWIGTMYGGLNLLNNRGVFIKFKSDPKSKNSIINNRINALIEDDAQNLWIGTSEGIDILNYQTNQFTLIQNEPRNIFSLNNNDVRCLFKDKSGMMWIATVQGVSTYSKLKERFKKFQREPNKTNTLSNNFITSFAEDASGNLWLGTREGLNYYDFKSNTFKNFYVFPESERGLSSNEITCLFIDPEQKIWVGTKNGLNLFDPWINQTRVFRPDPLNPNSINNEIFTIYQDRLGQMWLGTRKGLVKFDAQNGVFEFFRPNPTADSGQNSNSVYTIKEDRFGALWIGTLGSGLADFNRSTKQFTRYIHTSKDSSTISNNGITSIIEDKLGFIWIGTYGGGLNRFDRKNRTFTKVLLSSNTPNEIINAIVEDEENNLWISTSKSLIKYDTRNRTTRIYDILDGLQSRQFNLGAGIRLKTGELAFGGVAGFNLFNPLTIVENKYVPPLGFTSFKVLDKNVPLHQAVYNLAYNENYISFEFSALSYAISDKNQFAYKLEGFDDDWIYSGNRHTTSYGNLPPGNYVFKFKASNSDGLWNENAKSIHFNIERPFWSTWWFISLCVLIFSLALIFGFRYRTNSINKRNRWLEIKVRQRTAELEKARLEAESAKVSAENASKIKSGFLANMSHEIRTPLNGIIGFADLLLKYNLTPDQLKYLDLIRSSSDTLLKLLSDILDISKIEQGKLNIENIVFNFQDVIHSTLLPYQYRANEKGLQFMLSFDPRIPNFISSDPTRIKQLIVNLVSNSLKFTDRGGIILSFEADNNPTQDGEFFYINGYVADTGIGVPPEKQNLIFDTFTQADGSFTRKFGGSGLGLSIVKQLLKLMGGDIVVISPSPLETFKSNTPGACFKFRFKVQSKLNYTANAKLPDEFTNKLKFDETYEVLLVEDNKINQMLASAVLENFGVKVTTADDGLQGFEMAKSGDYNLILMDVQMPVMNGYEATTAIRHAGIKVPIIGLTANVYQEDIEKCIDAGMNAHIGKPFTEQDLFAELKKWV